MKSILNKKFLGVKVSNFLFFVGMYTFMGFLYHTTLWVSGERMNKDFWDLLKWSEFFPELISFLVMFSITIPIWILIFRGLAHLPTSKSLLVHLIALPLFVYFSFTWTYRLKDDLGIWHLEDTASIWDIYIPSLLYLVQFGILHAWAYYEENREEERKASALREMALKSEIAAIKAQLNPHFLYNVFNTISASVPPAQEHTREMIARLSDLFRYQLKASQNELVPLREEMAFVRKYLQLEKERLGERLALDIDIPEELMDESVPPMILQPLVENSLRHGLSSLIEGGRIGIKAFRKENKIHYEVSDTGIGVKDKEGLMGQGIGLTNTLIRLEKAFDSTLTIEDNQPRGLKVSFVI